MKRRIVLIVAVVLVAVFLLWWFFKGKKGQSKGYGTRTPGAWTRPPGYTGGPQGDMWGPSVDTGVGGGSISNLADFIPSSMAPSLTALPSSGKGIATIRPQTMPPYTLGPVPNGVTRVPEPPTTRPVEESDPDLVNGGYSLFDQPAGSRATSIGGVAVPAVQNPWDVGAWRFLVGVDVNTALNIIANLFPSFPVSTRKVTDGPLMSGAVTLKYDDGGRVVSVIRD